MHHKLFECTFCTINYYICYTLHPDVNFTAMLDGNLEHMNCTCVLLKWHMTFQSVKIKILFHKAEDVIDTFIITVTKHRRRKSKLRKLIHSCDRAIAFHEVASKIESIKNIIKEIYENRSKYGIEIVESSGGNAEMEEILHRRRRYVEEDQLVGFEHDTELLVKVLIEEKRSWS